MLWLTLRVFCTSIPERLVYLWLVLKPDSKEPLTLPALQQLIDALTEMPQQIH
jgi:hypothetical protein